jgi:hypothetical protein
LLQHHAKGFVGVETTGTGNEALGQIMVV